MYKPTAASKKKMRAAVASLKDYLDRYDKQQGYESYSEETLIDDVLYGLGIALDSRNAYANGYEKFKTRLISHLRPNVRANREPTA